MKKETIKNKLFPYKANFRPKLSLWLIVIVSIIPFDKFVDAMDRNKNYLICMFMNINENDENHDLLYYHLKSEWVIGCTLHS